MNADLTFERWGDDGWAFSDPIGRTSATLLVYPFGGGHAFAEVATAGTPDDEDLPARVLAGLADEVVALRAENERLRKEIEHRRSWMNRQPFCPDHRDKLGDECPSCKTEELTRLLAEAEEGVRKLYEWAYAQEWETEEEQIVGEVTREMATDAGEPGMVGMPVYGKVKATWVLAESGEPWRSLRDDNEFVQRALQSGEGEKG